MFRGQSFSELVPVRIQRALARLEGMIWEDRRELAVEWTGSSARHRSWAEVKELKRKRVGRPFFWGKLFEQSWFRVEIPKECRGPGWHLEWKEQGESTAYIHGEPYAGLDVTHFTCALPKGVAELWVEVQCLESAIWAPLIKRPAITEQGCRFERACLVRRNEEAWQAYHDLFVLFELLTLEHKKAFPRQPEFGPGPRVKPSHDRISVLHRRLLALLDGAVDVWERQGLEAMRRNLAKAYRDLSAREVTLDCVLTGHAHIDLVWLWPERCGEFKAVHTFATIDRLMEAYPEFRFSYSQPASYRAVERRAPGLMKRVRERIGQGRWEALGALEVESDTLLSCGESFARSLLLGQEGFRELTGKPSRIAWMPDIFGYSASLPQLFRQAGVEFFFTNKLTWGNCTPFPHSSFVWQGPDGSEVLAHSSSCFDYNGQALPSELNNAALGYRQSDIHGELLIPTGFGDGGGGPTPEMCERVRRMKSLAGLPRAQWGSVQGFFDRLGRLREELPLYRGELYLQYHRGVLTSHGAVKEAYRAAERGLQLWEAAHCVADGGPIDREAWRRLVFFQFHDCLPGSSVREVYEEIVPELEGMARQSRERALKLLGSAGKESLFNPLPAARNVIVKGEVRRLGPLCGAAMDDLPVLKDVVMAKASLREISNERVIAKLDEWGRVTALSVDGSAAEVDGALCEFGLYPDFPHAHDAWDLDRPALKNGFVVRTPARGEVEQAEGSGVAVSFRRMLSEKSSVLLRYRLEAGSPVLRVELEVDFRDENKLLKILFPTRHNGEQARFAAPFGSVLRSQQPGQPYDDAQWEVPGSRWAAVCDDGEENGLCVMSEAKYGWSCKSGRLELSLLRSVPVTDDEKYPTLRGKSKGALTDIGRHTIRLALGHYAVSHPLEKNPAWLAEELFSPVLPYRGGPVDAGLEAVEGASSLVPVWAKPVEGGGWILRLHETMGQRGKAVLKLKKGWKAMRTDLLELRGKNLRGGVVEFRPYELVSMWIRPSR